MKSIFEISFDFILAVEGDESDNPKDNGGLTKFGISKKSYPLLDIKNLTIEDAKEIYRKDFWQVVHGDKLPCDVALCVFDAAVNQGPGASVGMLQNCLGLKVDNVMGPNTILNTGKMRSIFLIEKFIAARFSRYLKAEDYETFGKGWSIRLVKLARMAAIIRALDSELKST